MRQAASSIFRRLFKRVGVGTDIGATVVLQGVGALMAYGVNILLARSLGQSGWDAYALCLQTYILIGASIVDFGIVAVALPRMSAARGEFTPVFIAAWRLRLVTFAVGLVVSAGLTLLFGDAELLLPVVIGFAATIFSAKFTGLRQVCEVMWRIKGRTWVMSTIAVVDVLVLLILVLALWQSDAMNVTTAMIALAFASVPGFLLVTIPILRLYRRSGYAGIHVPKRYYRGLALGALPIGVMALTAQLFARVEPLVLNATLGREYVGEYVAAVLPLAGTTFFAVSVSIGLVPLISQIHRRTRDDVEMSWVLSIGGRLLGGVAMVIGLTAFLFAEPIMGLFGPQYVEYAYILRIYTVTNGLEYIVVFFDQSLLAVDSRRQVLIGTLLSLVLALVFFWIAIPVWGLVGILVSKATAVACKIVYQLSALRAGMRRGAFAALVRLAWGVAVVVGLLFLTQPLATLPRAVVCLAVTAAMLWVTGIINVRELGHLRKLQLS